MDDYDLKNAIELAFEYASEINKYVDDMTPWKISIETEEERKKLNDILFILISDLRKVAIMLLPFFENKMRELLNRVGTPYDDTLTLEENLAIHPTHFRVLEK